MPLKRIKLATALISLWLAIATCTVANAASGWAAVQKLTGILTAWDGQPNNAKVYRAAAQYIDYDTIAQRSLGSPQWNKLTATQRTQFTGTLEKLMEQRYYVRWHKIFSRGKLTFAGQSSSGGDSLVKTNLVVGKKTDSITWRLKSGDNKIVSMAVADKDLVDRLSQRLQLHLKKSGFDGMLAWMESKAKTASTAGPDSETTASVTGEAN